jgi:hypothetical protein
VISNDGWESVTTDIIGIHDYEDQPQRLLDRYGKEDRTIERIAERERPGGRLLILDASNHVAKPIMLTEFGGIAFAPEGASVWGYSWAKTNEELAERYAAMMSVVRSMTFFSGFCYTQFADTYQEANGLLFADRTPKFPLEQIAAATVGPPGQRAQVEVQWRERMMESIIYRDIAEDHRISPA